MVCVTAEPTPAPAPAPTPAGPPAPTTVLDEAVWTRRADEHAARVDELVRGHVERASRREKHPVWDFLWTYYSYRPAQLRRWHPGAGVVLSGPAAHARLAWRGYTAVPVPGAGPGTTGATLDVAGFMARRRGAVEHVLQLLTATAGRAPVWGCSALHEWAMVYRLGPDAVRHTSLPLRLGHAGTDAVVEQGPLRCTHADAYRFFTAPARPLNPAAPTRANQVELEQPGCLHATMDLYKWCYKLDPALPSDLVLECFELACDVRLLDMAASPYDCTSLGVDPVPVETPEGRAEFVRRQRELSARAEPLRARAMALCSALLDGCGTVGACRTLSPMSNPLAVSTTDARSSASS